jgi:polyisoprenoid-binding protein YceI
MNPNATALGTQVTPVPPTAPTPIALYEIDPAHSSASFKVRHLMVANVRGELGEVRGQVRLDEADPTRSSVEATIDTTAIATRDEKRDAHLRSPDFFDVAAYPTITFRSTRVVRGRGGHLLVTGDLTIRGVTREATLDVEPLSPEVRDPWGSTKRGVTATTRINRKDFNVSWSAALDGGGVVVGDEISVTIEVELAKRS